MSRGEKSSVSANKIDYRNLRAIKSRTECGTIPSRRLTGLGKKEQRIYSRMMKLAVILGLDANRPIERGAQ